MSGRSCSLIDQLPLGRFSRAEAQPTQPLRFPRHAPIGPDRARRCRLPASLRIDLAAARGCAGRLADRRTRARCAADSLQGPQPPLGGSTRRRSSTGTSAGCSFTPTESSTNYNNAGPDLQVRS